MKFVILYLMFGFIWALYIIYYVTKSGEMDKIVLKCNIRYGMLVTNKDLLYKLVVCICIILLTINWPLIVMGLIINIIKIKHYK